MKHHTTKSFWEHYKRLPLAAQKLADKNFRLLKHNPRHPSLQLKKIDTLWSARVGAYYRVLGLDQPDAIYWFWIGTHPEYERLLSA